MASDLGSRTFATCITKHKTLEIGTNTQDTIIKYFIKKDKIMKNREIKKEIKKKNEKIINKKIKNLVEDLHWKTIKIITDTADTIIIGDIHSKNIVEQKKLNRMIKRVMQSLSYYKFKQRLEYKCLHKNKILCKPNEWMTSQMCSCCGNIHKKLGSKKIFECHTCKIVLDRDINSSINMYIKSVQ